jgi:hypothetical protein
MESAPAVSTSHQIHATSDWLLHDLSYGSNRTIGLLSLLPALPGGIRHVLHHQQLNPKPIPEIYNTLT